MSHSARCRPAITDSSKVSYEHCMTDFAFESGKPEMYTSFYMALRDGWNKFPSIQLLPKLGKKNHGTEPLLPAKHEVEDSFLKPMVSFLTKPKGFGNCII